MDWKASVVEVGLGRSVEAKWRVEDNENEIKLIVLTNGKEHPFTISPPIHPNSYESFAELLIIELNR